MDSAVEFQESTTTTLEWTVRSLRSIFESSRGETKSKVLKSVKFGGGRWQILFYSNSGHEGGNFVSLYLSCEPTEEEKERAVNGKWVREGVFKFSFELRNVNRGILSNPKEACDHAFSAKTANWGWAQFAKRDQVYYNTATVKHVDAFLIICHITSSPSKPTIPPANMRSVPRSLMDAVGDMLDDPTYSDVRFVLPPRKKSKGKSKPPRTIFAAKKMLQRVEYFDTMFGTGFAEAGYPSSPVPGTYRRADSISLSMTDDDEPKEDSYHLAPFDDSDESSDDESNINDETHAPTPALSGFAASATPSRQVAQSTPATMMMPPSPRSHPPPSSDGSSTTAHDTHYSFAPTFSTSNTSVTAMDSSMDGDGDDMGFSRHASSSVMGEERGEMGVKESLVNNPASNDAEVTPIIPHATFGDEGNDVKPDDLSGFVTNNSHGMEHEREAHADLDVESLPGPRKTRVVVKDVAYATYHAFLYYLYTDSIVFSPLTSDFIASRSTSHRPSLSSSSSSSSFSNDNHHLALSIPPSGTRDQKVSYESQRQTFTSMESTEDGHQNRREWVRAWLVTHPGKPAPCSAKACYRLADKLGLSDLKERAFQHIVKSLTVTNVPYEVFSSFSAAFEDVRKVQVEFFLMHWSEIKANDAMRNVFQQIRLGRHPGFEEVWPAIIVNLEFVPKSNEAASESQAQGRELIMA